MPAHSKSAWNVLVQPVDLHDFYVLFFSCNVVLKPPGIKSMCDVAGRLLEIAPDIKSEVGLAGSGDHLSRSPVSHHCVALFSYISNSPVLQ